jgi:hypothetical protein
MAERTIVHISGLANEQLAYPLAGIISGSESTCLLITSSFVAADTLAKNLAHFSSRRILTVPEDDSFFMRFEAKSHGGLNARLAAFISMQK